MIKYAKVINKETGLCEVGLGTNKQFYKSIGMVELDVQQSDIDNKWYLIEKCPMQTEEEKIEAKKEQFNKDFFLTSLGYIRRKVTMKTGETKDFLSDLLPVISMGVQSGQAVTIIAYKEPDFTQDVTDWEALQEQKTVTAEFINECFARLNVDFTG